MRYSEFEVSSGIFQQYHNSFIRDGGRDREQNMQSYYSNEFQGPAVTGKERVGTGSVNSLSFLLQSKTQLKAENRAGEKGGGEAKQKLERLLLIYFFKYYLEKPITKTLNRV